MNNLSKRSENRWTPEEDEILIAAVIDAGPTICWRRVATALPGRTNKSCRKRWIHSLDPNLRKGRWSAAEDAALISAFNQHGGHWYQVARTINNGRTDDQCAKRWREALDPNIRKDRWTEQEDKLLIEAFTQFGRKWNEISAALNGRPSVQCRNRWLSLCRSGKLKEINEEATPESASPPGLSLDEYDSEFIVSSRRPSTSTCSSMSTMPTTPLSASGSLSHPSYHSSSSYFSEASWQSSSRYHTDILSCMPPTPPYYPAFGNSSALYPSRSWQGDLVSGRDNQPHLELGYSHGVPNSPLSVLCDAPAAATTVSSPPPSVVSSSSESSFSITNSSCPPPIGSIMGGPFSPHFPHVYTAPRVQANPFIMNCPVPCCAYYTQSLLEIWRHITWGHVSCRTNGDGVSEGIVERLVLGQAA